VRRRRQLAGNHISAHITRPDQTNNHRRGRSRDCEKNKGGVSGLVDKDIPLLPGFPPLLSSTLPGPGASEVTTLWRYTNAFIIIIIFYTPGSKDPRG